MHARNQNGSGVAGPRYSTMSSRAPQCGDMGRQAGSDGQWAGHPGEGSAGPCGSGGRTLTQLSATRL